MTMKFEAGRATAAANLCLGAVVISPRGSACHSAKNPVTNERHSDSVKGQMSSRPKAPTVGSVSATRCFLRFCRLTLPEDSLFVDHSL